MKGKQTAGAHIDRRLREVSHCGNKGAAPLGLPMILCRKCALIGAARLIC